MSHVFYPHSISFVSKSAKQLRRAFPGLNPNAAHEAVACALGFARWFDCRSRIEAGGYKPSAPDEDVSQEARIARRYQQIVGIVDATQLPIFDVEFFVRCWSLTAQAPGQLERFITGYEALRADKKEAEANGSREWGIPPEEIAEGVLVGYEDTKSYQYIELSVQRALAVPMWMRGNASGFLRSECFLYPALPGVFSKEEEAAQLDHLRWDPHLLYWATGKYPEDSSGTGIPAMLEQAKRKPNDWFALAVRSDMTGHAPPDPWPQFAPALRGKQFASFLRDKGIVRLRDVQWFRISQNQAARLGDTRFGGWGPEEATLQLDARECEPSAPLYASPFKHGAMRRHEWTYGHEGGAQPIAHEMDDDDDDPPESSHGPAGPSVVEPPVSTV